MARPLTPANTATTTSHALTIHVNGRMIGAINSWAPAQRLGITPVFEFGQVTGPYGQETGAPYEKVPGNIDGMQVRVGRYDLYTAQMEAVFGNIDLTMLSADPGRTEPGTGLFDVRERWNTPNNVNNYAYIYLGCWFTDIGRTMSTTDNRIVNVNATLEYTRRIKVPL